MDTKERLLLFSRVCDAIHHAHRKGIIHRDIKPYNILVASDREEGSLPKVIDFGIARAIDRHLSERTLFTEQGRLVGTPEYMSPEQADPAGSNGIDTTTDVYSLGVLLSLRTAHRRASVRLPGTPPRRLARDREKDSRGGSAETEHETLFVWRSVGIRGEEALHVGGALRKDLRGDLDWIVMKAMEKGQERRYPSASELSADIHRFLDRRPVAAGPPSASYRMKKFVARHRAGTAAGLAFVVLAIGRRTWRWPPIVTAS